MTDCYTCAQEAGFDSLPTWERIAFDEHWRVAHSFDSALAGWLVLIPRRHVTAVADLTDVEAADLGAWQVRLSRALRDVTGCPRTYVAQFAEKQGFAHVHFHVIPRAVDLEPSLRGPGVFAFFDRRPISTDERDRISASLRSVLA